jgi:hypothetical protein
MLHNKVVIIKFSTKHSVKRHVAHSPACLLYRSPVAVMNEPSINLSKILFNQQLCLLFFVSGPHLKRCRKTVSINKLTHVLNLNELNCFRVTQMDFLWFLSHYLSWKADACLLRTHGGARGRTSLKPSNSIRHTCSFRQPRAKDVSDNRNPNVLWRWHFQADPRLHSNAWWIVPSSIFAVL